MKKKLLFTAYNLELGGIETALINLLKVLDYNKYEVTLLLEEKKGIFLKEVPQEVKIEVYTIHDDKIAIIRKIKNRLKLWKWIVKNYHQYDFAGCFTTYSIPGAILSRFGSKNNAFWVHSNYYHAYRKNVEKVKCFFLQRKVNRFQKIIFVANESKNDFVKIYPELEEKCTVLNNVLDYQLIEKKSKEKIKEKRPKGPLFLFVGRLDEDSKKLSRLIESFSILLKNNDANLWIVGDGQDRNLCEELIEKYHIEDKVTLLGKKQNPYSYMSKADLMVLTSDYEGFPVVCVESMILNKPFLSTISLSDPYLQLSDYGKIVEKDSEKIAQKMEEFIKNSTSWRIKKFIPDEYQAHLIRDFEKIIDGK